MNSQDYKKVEIVKASLLSSSLAKVPTFLILALFSFALHCHVLMVWGLVFPFQTLLFVVADFNQEDEGSQFCEYNDGKMFTSFFLGYQR